MVVFKTITLCSKDMTVDIKILQDFFPQKGGPRSVMVSLLTRMQEVRGLNPGSNSTKFGAHLQVAKMRQGFLKEMVYANAEHPG